MVRRNFCRKSWVLAETRADVVGKMIPSQFSVNVILPVVILLSSIVKLVVR